MRNDFQEQCFLIRRYEKQIIMSMNSGLVWDHWEIGKHSPRDSMKLHTLLLVGFKLRGVEGYSHMKIVVCICLTSIVTLEVQYGKWLRRIVLCPDSGVDITTKWRLPITTILYFRSQEYLVNVRTRGSTNYPSYLWFYDHEDLECFFLYGWKCIYHTLSYSRRVNERMTHL